MLSRIIAKIYLKKKRPVTFKIVYDYALIICRVHFSALSESNSNAELLSLYSIYGIVKDDEQDQSFSRTCVGLRSSARRRLEIYCVPSGYWGSGYMTSAMKVPSSAMILDHVKGT